MFKPERLAAFCDGVIAIAITLLVLGLEVPSVHSVPDRELKGFLLESFHPVCGYVSSFLLVGTYWLQHYVIFHYITHVNRIFIVLNGLFLLSVSFVPFPTGLQAAYREDELAMVMYAATQAVCGISLLGVWGYASHKHRLIPASITPQVIKSMTQRLAFIPIISIAALLVSLVDISVSRFMFIGIPIAYLSHYAVDRAWATSTETER